MDKIILSICIPTYNRKDELIKKIKELLQSNYKTFDIIVLDNCSSDGTYEALKEINDERLKVFRNDFNIGGILNPLKVITYGDGIYSILVLDKDYIDVKKINEFINFISKNDNSHGYCQLNVDVSLENIIYNDLYEKIKNSAFLSKHPSGMFWKTEEYKNSFTLNNIFKNHEVFGFYFELINAELCINSRLPACIYNNSLIYTETVEVSVANKTQTYNKNNLFFNPIKRKDEYIKYINHVNSLIDQNKYLIKVHRLLIRRFLTSLVSSNRLRNDIYHLKHYGITKKDIPLKSFVVAFFVFWSWYFSKSNNIPVFLKFLVFSTLIIK